MATKDSAPEEGAEESKAEIDTEEGPVTRRLVLWGVLIGVPVAVWLARGSGPPPEFTQAWVWILRGLIVVAVGVEIAKWANRRQG
ncbi:MAG TPA: hypothetical protein VGL62_10195 [Vicinamibacterales bacterium]|jgi:hypothetical protein